MQMKSAGGAGAPAIDILKKKRKGTPPNRVIREWVSVALCLLGYGRYGVSIMFTDDEEMASLNLQYREKKGTTDVLSFSQIEGDMPVSETSVLGDIVISTQRATIQAQENGLETQEEILRLLVHGLCHLAGYDHERSSVEGRKMRAKEKAILKKIGNTTK